MKKLIASILALGFCFVAFCGCFILGNDSTSSDSSSTRIEMIDYAAQVKLDMNSETHKQKVTVENYIDGDTTHFKVPTSIVDTGLLKARYLAVNTPESTGQIEPWGKKASDYTKAKLKSATDIIIETDGTDWAVDSTGERYLVWVWYKTAEMTDYRCVNIELLQEGLAVGSKASSTRYGEVCVKAIDQATTLKLHVHSNEKDPDYFYGTAIELDLRELRLNVEKYNGSRVAFEGYVTQYNNNGVFVEDYDEESDAYYGIYVFYGYDSTFVELLQEGNHVRIVGNVSYYETGDSYQVSNLKYNAFKPNDPNNVKVLEGKRENTYLETTAATFYSKRQVTVVEEVDGEPKEVIKTLPYAKLALNTAIEMKNLKVKSMYTTSNGGNNEGAITITCEVDGQEIIVRTMKLYDENNNLITQDYFKGKTIDVKGIIDYFSGDYQIKVFELGDITLH